MKGLSSEHEEMLRELMQSETWHAVLTLAELSLQRHGEAVLKYDLNKGSRELLVLKAKYEGAKSLIQALQQAKRDFKIED